MIRKIVNSDTKASPGREVQICLMTTNHKPQTNPNNVGTEKNVFGSLFNGGSACGRVVVGQKMWVRACINDILKIKIGKNQNQNWALIGRGSKTS